MRAVGKVLDSLLPDFRAFTPPIVRTRHWGPFSGEPNDFDVHFIFATRGEVQTAVESGIVELAAERVREALRRDDYPSDAIATFRFHHVSEEEIKGGGGEFAYFR